MPGFDRTGPLQQGPMTGKGRGGCGRGFCFTGVGPMRFSQSMPAHSMNVIDDLQSQVVQLQKEIAELKSKM